MSTTTARPTLRERVAAAILEAAARALAEQGESASMSEVAAAAGVARATVYRYFPSRDALLEALGRFALDDAGERLEAARLDQVPVAEGFSRAVRALVGVGDYFVVLARDRTRADPDEFERRIASPLRGLIERGQSLGEVRGDVPARWLMESLFALVVGVLPAEPSLGVEDAIDAITSLFLDGARARGASRSEPTLGGPDGSDQDRNDD